jgi:hypothetical protein
MHDQAMDLPAVYEARYGLNRVTRRMIAISVIFVAGGLAIPQTALRAVIVALASMGMLMFVMSALRGAVALRVDEAGVTFGAMPLRRMPQRTVPWSDIDHVVLWAQTLPNTASMDYVGVALRAGVPPLAPMRRSVPGVPVSPELVASSIPCGVWQFDANRFTEAIATWHPSIAVKDIRDPGRDGLFRPAARALPRWPARLLWRVGAPVLAVIAIVASAPHVVPAVEAHFGDGTRGELTGTASSCHRCATYGTFVSDDRRTVRDQVEIHTVAPFAEGGTITAYDTADPSWVFAVDSADWWHMLLVFGVGLAIGAVWIPTVAVRLARRVARTKTWRRL